MTQRGPIIAAGAVVLRRRRGTTEVLLVHRPKYDDWAYPKGKLDPGEAARTAAVREVLEETGVAIRLGPPLGDQTYPTNMNGTGRLKLVHYWVGRAVGDDDVSKYLVNHEIDDVRWVPVEDAPALMTYEHDRDTLAEALPHAKTSHPFVVLRHAQARSRKRWKGDDRERTLTQAGEHQAERLPPALAAYGVQRLVSSSSRRCWTTLSPYAVAAELDIEVTDVLSEEGVTDHGLEDEVSWALDLREPVVLCTHRPVLPRIFGLLGIEPPVLEPAGMVVVHHRKGRVTAVEQVAAPSAH